jgi:membrane protease YdiL (CAAX protease family)
MRTQMVGGPASSVKARQALPHRGRVELIRAHPIAAYFILAYGVSWLLLALLYGLLRLPAALVILLQTAGPTVAAIVVVGALGGRPAIGELVSRVRIWRVGRRWYVLAVVGLPVACIAASLVVPGGADAFGAVSLGQIPVMFLVYLFVGWLSGPLFEEPGWRGFALPRMQTEMGPLAATLVLGVLWAAWHVPQFLIPEWADQNGGSDATTVVLFLVMVVAIAPLLTWVFNHTKGSLLLAMLTHSSINASLSMLPTGSTPILVVGVITFGVIALVLIAVTRGRLGLQPDSAPWTGQSTVRTASPGV